MPTTGKVAGVTIPDDLNDNDIASETNFFNPVYAAISGLDAAVGQLEPFYHTTGYSDQDLDSEKTAFTVSIPANLLGTNNVLKIKGMFALDNDTTGDQVPTVKLYYGSTSVSANIAIDGGVTSPTVYTFDGFVMAKASTSAQIAGWVINGNGTDGDTWDAVDETFAEDSTGALDLKVTFTASNALLDLHVYYFQVFLSDVS